jgi:serine/threonine protein kinase
MNKPYNEKSDIWSIGAMMYQLHFKRIPYPGFCEQQILNKIKTGYARKDPSDPQFKDLLDKIFVMDPVQRISWDAYFNHPFFINEKEKKNSI